jgi:GTPase SAR1 family protein
MITTRLFELRDAAERLRIDLLSLKNGEQPLYQATLQEEIDSLSAALETSKIPDFFKVAVVGQFKTGKSSFVNRLAEERLAGVETNPETAAITFFRYGEEPRAVVKMLTREEWTKMVEIHEESPHHPEAYRVSGLREFNESSAKRKKSHGEMGNITPIDPVSLEKEWIRPEGLDHEILCRKWGTKEGKQEFRSAIRRFTSTKEPYHYFVKEIIVYAPVPILKDHVELIDTPGLNDTQLYRGQLTEDLIADVDAILFLTQSGASFSQFDKEFLVRQLRKKRLSHLRLIVTQVDVTFDKAKADAAEEDIDPPTFEEVLSKEDSRLRAEVSRTLDELLQENKVSEEDGYYYISQLDSLKIHFTSAKWDIDGDKARSGINGVREALLEVLSENYRITQMVDNLDQKITHTKKRLNDFFRERQDLIHRDFDPAKVRENIRLISDSLARQLDGFGVQMSHLTTAHDTGQDALKELIDSNVDKMCLLSGKVLSEYERSDIGRHWRSRRSGYWGFLGSLGGKVADRVFPVMETMLNRQLGEFRLFVTSVQHSLEVLEREISLLEAESVTEGLPSIDFSQAKKAFLSDYLIGLEKSLADEKDTVVKLLDEFATSELKGKLSTARNKVSVIEGAGTTMRQSNAVVDFYDDIETEMSNALDSFARKKFETYAKLLRKSAKGLFPKLRASIEATLASRSQAIEESIRNHNQQSRERLTDYLEKGIGVLEGKSITKTDHEPTPEIRAELSEAEFRLADDETGRSYESMFRKYLDGAKKIEMDEPYLGKRYQLDNFQRFCELVARLGSIESIQLTTGIPAEDEFDESESRLVDLKRTLGEMDIAFGWSRSSGHHNRQIKTDHGWTILSDRGLDIFKRLENRNDFGRHDLAFRKCKPTQIHIRRSL